MNRLIVFAVASLAVSGVLPTADPPPWYSAAGITLETGRQGAFTPGVGENDQGKAFIRPSDM